MFCRSDPIDVRIAAAYEGGKDLVVEALNVRCGILGMTDCVSSSSSYLGAGLPLLSILEAWCSCAMSGALLVRSSRLVDSMSTDSVDSERTCLLPSLLRLLLRMNHHKPPPIITTRSAVAAAAIPTTAGFDALSSFLESKL